MPSSALVELLHRVEAAIREYSEELISQLARREELEFEKEVKNTFITALMEVQNRQKEQRESGKRRRRDKALSLQGGGSDSTEKTGSMPTKVTSSNHLINSNITTNKHLICIRVKSKSSNPLHQNVENVLLHMLYILYIT